MNLERLNWGYVIKMKSKKSQLLILSGMLLFLLLIFIYYIETENSYITKSSQDSILNNIIYETCIIGKNSNGSQIDSRYRAFSGNVSQYCNSNNNYCNLIINNNTAIPPLGNWSKLNYTHYDYSIVYSWDGYNTTLDFNC